MKFKIFSYFVFIIFSTLILLYIKFPGGIAAEYIEQRFAQNNSDIKVQVDDVQPLLPPGIKISSLLINYRESIIEKVDSLHFVLNLTTIFKKKLTLSFDAKDSYFCIC